MADSSAPDDKSLQLNAVFEVMNQAYREAVVSRALSFRGELTSEGNSALNAAIQKSRIRVTGYRDSLRAPHTLLRGPISQALDFYPELAGAVLQAWVESQQTLHDKIVEYLKDAGLEAEYPDFQAGKFRRLWPRNVWHSSKDKFIQENAEDQFNEDDAALMLCYVTGRLPLTAGEGEPDKAAGSVGEYLDQLLEFLKVLPPTAPEWRDVLPNFIESVSYLIEEKESELKWADDFGAAVQTLRTGFYDLLAFFEQDTDSWAAARVSPGIGTASALGSVEVLHSLLADYLPVHDRAPSITEEKERISKRNELLPKILGAIQDIGSLMTGEADGNLAAGFPAIPRLNEAKADPPADADSSPAPATPVHEHETSPLQEALTASEQAAEQPGFSDAEYSALQSENRVLQDDAHALRAVNQDLREEVEALKAELYSSQEVEESWRLAYRAAIGGSTEEPEEAHSPVESVNAAVEMAKSRFKQELLFSPNSESNIESNPYIYPNKVWEALQWLASTYYPSKLGRLRVTDFDQSIREACGWWYKGDQGETTLSRYEKSYTTRVEGKRHWLAEHIGKGTSFDARYTIRIAFDWDRERRQVIVGYIGRHQQTDAS